MFCQLACELLFKVEPECSHITHFVDCFEWYFKTKFSPEQVEAKSLQDLVSRPPVAENIKVSYTCRYMYMYMFMSLSYTEFTVFVHHSMAMHTHVSLF